MNHFTLPKLLIDRETFLLDVSKDRNILHLGCADHPYTDESIEKGNWLHSKLSKVASSCVGIDLNTSSINFLRDKHGINNIICGDVEKLDQLQIGQFDVVIAGEIIEHLNNPGLFLESVKSVLSPSGKLVITTTNAFCFRRFIQIPFGYESIHPDHTYYYSHATLYALTNRFGFSLRESFSYRIPNKKPFLPYLVERFATLLSSNWGEGIIHVYSQKEN